MLKWEFDLERIFQDLRDYENNYQTRRVYQGPFDPQLQFYRGAIQALFGILAAAGALDQYIAWKEGSNEKSDHV